MTLDRNDPVVRRGALLLSALVLTPDSALPAYRSQRAADPELDVALLTKARTILDAVAFAIQGSETGSWRRIEQAWEIVRKIPPPPAKSDEALPKHAASEPAGRSTTTPAQAPLPQPAPPVAPLEPAWPALADPAPAPPLAAPVARQAPAPLPLAAPPRPAAVSPPPSREADHFATSVDETGAVDLAVIAAAVLPFAGGASAPPRPIAEMPGAAPDVGETAEIDLAILAEATMPFATAAKPVDAVRDDLTTEQYASLCAERQHVGPAREAEVDARYGLRSMAAARALDERWRRRHAADPALHAHHRELVARYRDWLRSRG